MVRLRRDAGNEWRKVVVDVKVTSTDKMNEAFKEKDGKYREWATKDTREKKVVKAVMVPLVVSHDGAVHRDTDRRWKNFASTSRLTGADGVEHHALQRRDRREIFQQGELGLRGVENGAPRGV